MTKIVASIEARMTSRRLPGKVMRPILGRPMLDFLLERLARAKRVEEIVIATTDRPTDDVIEELARARGVACFRGSEEDVLGRVLGAVRSVSADVLVEITGDCPLTDPELVDQLADIYLAGGYDHVSNILKPTYPGGFDTQVFSVDTLAEVERLTQDPSDREHVSLYIYSHPERFKLYNLESGLGQEFWNLPLMVDTLEDFEIIRGIFEELYPVKPAFGVWDVVELLRRRPEWMRR
jgi:spore coat polysaccharide biosynthesis protein SpsF